MARRGNEAVWFKLLTTYDNGNGRVLTLARNHGAHGKPVSDSFSHRHDVRNDVMGLETPEVTSYAAETGLNLTQGQNIALYTITCESDTTKDTQEVTQRMSRNRKRLNLHCDRKIDTLTDNKRGNEECVYTSSAMQSPPFSLTSW